MENMRSGSSELNSKMIKTIEHPSINSDELLLNGFYVITKDTSEHAPFADAYALIVCGNQNEDIPYVTNIAIHFNDGIIKLRTCHNSPWNEWKNIN